MFVCREGQVRLVEVNKRRHVIDDSIRRLAIIIVMILLLCTRQGKTKTSKVRIINRVHNKYIVQTSRETYSPRGRTEDNIGRVGIFCLFSRAPVRRGLYNAATARNILRSYRGARSRTSDGPTRARVSSNRGNIIIYF